METRHKSKISGRAIFSLSRQELAVLGMHHCKIENIYIQRREFFPLVSKRSKEQLVTASPGAEEKQLMASYYHCMYKYSSIVFVGGRLPLC